MTTNFSRRLAVLLISGGLIAGPAMSQELIVGHIDAPVAKSIAKNPTISDDIDPLPPGTPTDDYEFMGWCTGILTGHMDLYTKVKPQLDLISQRWNSVEEDNKQEADQQIEGHKLLARFRGVMAKAEAQKPSLGPSGQEAIKKGLDNWSKIDAVDKQTQAYSWMNFGLPIQCETKVGALEKTPIVVGRTAVTPIPVKAASAPVSAKAKPKTLHEIILGDGPPPDDGKQPLVAPGHLAPYGKSVVTELHDQEVAAKAAKAAKAKAEADAAANAGLRPSNQ
jgi:hypothetical protein